MPIHWYHASTFRNAMAADVADLMAADPRTNASALRRQKTDWVPHSLADVPDIDHLPRSIIRQAPSAEQPFRSQLVHSPKGFLNRRVSVWSMKVKHVHGLHPAHR